MHTPSNWHNRKVDKSSCLIRHSWFAAGGHSYATKSMHYCRRHISYWTHIGWNAPKTSISYSSWPTKSPYWNDLVFVPVCYDHFKCVSCMYVLLEMQSLLPVKYVELSVILFSLQCRSYWSFKILKTFVIYTYTFGFWEPYQNGNAY